MQSRTVSICRAILHIVSKFVSGLPISEVATRTGVSASTLRAWEARFGFPSVARLPGGHRRYDERDVERIGSAKGMIQRRSFDEVGPGGDDEKE